MNRKNKSEHIVVDVTDEEYRSDIARGLETDEVLLPGQHKFRRGGFLRRHGLVSAQIPAPVKISISVGADTGYPHKTGRFYSQLLTGAANLSRLMWIALKAPRSTYLYVV